MKTDPASLSRETLRVVHIVRPAQGGMVSQVRALLSGMPDTERFLAAPEDVVGQLARTWPASQITNPDRSPLYVVRPVPAGPSELLRRGEVIGRWSQSKAATLLHGHGLLWSPLFAAAAARARVPLVVTLHNLVPEPSSLSTVQKIALRVALSRAVRIIAVSEAVAASARVVLSGMDVASRIRVVRNGIDFAPFDDLALPSKADARRLLALPPEIPLAVCLARLSPEKGIADLIAAVAISRTPDIHVLIAGDGPDRGALARQIESAGLTGRILMPGRRDDIPRLLRAADIAVVPSRSEGLGLAAVEAMASGLPVIATCAGGLPEVVVEGETGFLCPVAAPVALAAALDAVFGLSPDRMRVIGDAGRERARHFFSAERMVRETREIYADSLTPAGKR